MTECTLVNPRTGKIYPPWDWNSVYTNEQIQKLGLVTPEEFQAKYKGMPLDQCKKS